MFTQNLDTSNQSKINFLPDRINFFDFQPLDKYLFFFLFLVITSCSQGPEDESIFSLRYNHDRGNPLAYKFTVLWNNQSNGYVYVIITPGPNQSPSQEWYLGSISPSISQLTSNYYFPDNNPSPTNYIIHAELRSSNTGNYNVLATSGASSIEIKYKIFNVIQLAMINDNLWPNYAPQQYDGLSQGNAALGDAKLVYNITLNRTGLSNTIDPEGNPIDFTSDLKMFRWAVWGAYGSLNGVEPKVSIICGIDDVSPTYITDINAHGFTIHDFSYNSPQICYILYSRIRNFYSNDYDKIRSINGSTIHEIGHAIGINLDDPNITPPHSGANANACLMITPYTPGLYTNCLFCAGHIQFISNQNWFVL